LFRVKSLKTVFMRFCILDLMQLNLQMIEQNLSNQRSTTLTVLCVLTIVGSILFILKGLISYSFLISSNDDRSEGVIYFINVIYLIEFLSCTGTFIGAILMITGKKTGLLLYGISSIVYIVLTIAFSCFCMFTIIGILIGLLQIIYLYYF
jgi:hypothetical protein